MLSLFVVPAGLGFALTRSWHGVLTAFLWGGLARVFILHHVTWSVNSICHFYGSRDFKTTDESTNNWALSLISFGESWHNNHHAFPTSAVHGLKRTQINASAAFISLLERSSSRGRLSVRPRSSSPRSSRFPRSRSRERRSPSGDHQDRQHREARPESWIRSSFSFRTNRARTTVVAGYIDVRTATSERRPVHVASR